LSWSPLRNMCIFVHLLELFATYPLVELGTNVETRFTDFNSGFTRSNRQVLIILTLYLVIQLLVMNQSHVFPYSECIPIVTSFTL
jgi:hypothetical protein